MAEQSGQLAMPEQGPPAPEPTTNLDTLAIPEEARPSNAPPSLAELAWMARAVSKAMTLPKALQNSPADILAVTLAGRELGLGPMAALRMIHIINGQTSIATELKLKFANDAGHEIVAVDEGPGFCVVGCKRHAYEPIGWALTSDTKPNGADALTAWTIASDIMIDSWEGESGHRRKVAKALTEKDNWRSYPRDMLFWRAASAFMRRHCPGVGGGIYTIEELAGAPGD